MKFLINIVIEYEGYDDVYGHSLDDDYSISPSDAAFMYDREGSRNQQKIGAYFQTVKDIAEEDENETAPSVSIHEINHSYRLNCSSVGF